VASAERLARRSESSCVCSSWRSVSIWFRGAEAAPTYVVVGDVFWQVHVDDCEAVLNRFGNVGLDRISL